MNLKSVVVAAAAIAAALGVSPQAVHAQGVGGVLEEIVVTARKREENLQEVPIAVTAFSADTVQELQLRSPTDIAAFTPGFSFVSGFGRDSDRPVVRGMSNILGEANASFFIDGIYVPGTITSTELQNLERIEVIKGPQAALYGRATFAGAINYVTRKPDNESLAQVSLSGAEHDQLDLMASFSGAIVEDSVYYSIAASHYEYGGEYRNTIDGRTIGGEETDTVSAKLMFTPSEMFEASLRLTWQQDDDDLFPMWLQGAQFNNCFDANASRPAARGYYCGEVNVSDTVTLRRDFLPNPGIHRDILRGALSLDWTLQNGMGITSITGLQREDQVRQLDVSYGGYDPLLYLYGLAVVGDLRGSFWRIQDQETDSFSQEFRLTSNQEQRLRWTLGAYYYQSNFDLPINDRINPMVDTVAELDPALAAQQPNSFPEESTLRNVALFGGLEYDLSESLRGTLELRYSEDRKNLTFLPVGGVGVTTTQKKTFDNVTPRATLTWLVSDTTTLYGNIAKGNKPGGFNDPGAPVEFYDEEESWNYELGLKKSLADGRAQWNTSVFLIDWTDQQLTLNAQRPDGTITSFIENIGETEVLGAETDLTVIVTENWDLTATYAYIDSEIQEYVNDQQALFFGCVPPARGATPAENAAYLDCVNQFGSVAGNSTPRSSKHQASLHTMARFPTANGNEFFLGANASYESSRYAQVHNLAETGAATRVGAQLGWRSENWDLTIWGKNLFDDDTAQDILRYIDSSAYNAAPFIPCPPPPFVFRTGENCGPYFSRQTDPNGNTITPRGFGITLPRGRQVGVTVNMRF